MTCLPLTHLNLKPSWGCPHLPPQPNTQHLLCGPCQVSSSLSPSTPTEINCLPPALQTLSHPHLTVLPGLLYLVTVTIFSFHLSGYWGQLFVPSLLSSERVLMATFCSDPAGPNCLLSEVEILQVPRRLTETLSRMLGIWWLEGLPQADGCGSLSDNLPYIDRNKYF